MKKFTFFIAMLLGSISIFAQATIVDTTAQNRNAVLEEFTGIHCTWCPDGHKISNEIEAAHPNNFFAINIHVGGYATPNAGEPDFRTSFGTAISSLCQVQAYPAGTMNRHLFTGWQDSNFPGLAMSRSHWKAAAEDSIMNKPSYVNVAATASINLSTRVMTIYVEGYFTGSGAPASMNLNVAVLQNNVEGPQTGMSKNPGQVLPNGKYNHMHILRNLVSGQWGTPIDTTTQGTLFSRTYTYTIPADINGVPMELGNLEVIAFLAESHQEVITGNKAVMNFITPAGISLVDLSAKNMTTLPGLCDASITPKVMIKNNSSTVIADTFNVSFAYNGGTAISQTITTPLNAGDSTVITFSPVNVTAQSSNISFSTDVDNTVHLIDIQTGNNVTATPTIFHMPSATIGATHTEDFESYPSYTKDITNTVILNPTDAAAFTINKGGVTGLTYELGGYGASTSSYIMNFYGIAAGETVDMLFHKLDCSNNTGYGIKFDYAYAQYSSENDRLQVQYSDDCGATWNTVWDKAGSTLKTTAPVSSGNFFPKANEWASATIDLSAIDGKSGVIIAFKGTSDYGNNLYIDNINIYNSTTVGIKTTAANTSVNIYPNPAKNQFNLAIDLAENSTVSYSIMNSMGQTVKSFDLGNLSAGSQLQKINISDLAQGLYMVQININGTITTKKLTVK